MDNSYKISRGLGMWSLYSHPVILITCTMCSESIKLELVSAFTANPEYIDPTGEALLFQDMDIYYCGKCRHKHDRTS